MKYYELICIVYLKKDIEIQDSFNLISKYISFSLAQNKEYLQLHNTNRYKFYTFNSFTPFEINKPYKANQNYTFTIRSIDEKLIDFLLVELRKNINNPYFLVVATKKRYQKQFFITELNSITPVIMTTKNGEFWSVGRDGDVIKLQKQLQDNLEKKYKEFYKEELKPIQNFIQLLEITNKKQQSIKIVKNGKPFKLWGNKFKIIPNEDTISQKLAFLALGAGLGEKNSFGAGFCLAKGVR
jgi:CRISPR-associated endoribonuclease Cas6